MHRCVQMRKTKRVDHALYKENEKTNVLSSIRSDFEMMGVCSTHITHGTHERLLHKSLCNCWAVNSGKTGEGRSMILTRKRQMFCPLLSKAERRNQEEEEYTSQVHFSSWKDHGSCPENYFQPCMDVKANPPWQTWLQPVMKWWPMLMKGEGWTEDVLVSVIILTLSDTSVKTKLPS